VNFLFISVREWEKCSINCVYVFFFDILGEFAACRLICPILYGSDIRCTFIVFPLFVTITFNS
jgi:hypothetical protein